jgi:hypothetical protein
VLEGVPVGVKVGVGTVVSVGVLEGVTVGVDDAVAVGVEVAVGDGSGEPELPSVGVGVRVGPGCAMSSTGVPAGYDPARGCWRMIEPNPAMMPVSAPGPVPIRIRSPMAKPSIEATSSRVVPLGAATVRKVLPGRDVVGACSSRSLLSWSACCCGTSSEPVPRPGFSVPEGLPLAAGSVTTVNSDWDGSNLLSTTSPREVTVRFSPRRNGEPGPG